MTPRVRAKMRRSLTKKSDERLQRYLLTAAEKVTGAEKLGLGEEYRLYWEVCYELACAEQARRVTGKAST